MQFRVIKIKVAEDSYEYIITNLPYSFDLEDLKTCYHWPYADILEMPIFDFLKYWIYRTL